MLATFAIAVATTSSAASRNQERATLIDQINNNPRNLWKATAYRRFEAQPVGAAKELCGVDMDAYLADLSEKLKTGDVRVAHDRTGETADDLPDSFDAATNPAWKSCSAIIADVS